MRTRLLAAALAVVTLAAAPVAAQQCGLATGTGVQATGGAAYYETAHGITGTAVGVDASARLTAPLDAVRVGYLRVMLDGPDADLGRLAAAFPVPARLPLRLRLCVVPRAGVARLPVADDALVSIAGGIGVRLARPLASPAPVVVYGEIRGLAGSTTGSLYGLSVEGAGYALGGELGLRAALGKLELGLTLSADGLDDGLGVTPFPDLYGGLYAGLRF